MNMTLIGGTIMISDTMKEMAKQLGVEVINLPLQRNIDPEDVIGLPKMDNKMTEAYNIHELRDKADEIDSDTYFILCEDDTLCTEEFVDGRRKIIKSNSTENDNES